MSLSFWAVFSIAALAAIVTAEGSPRRIALPFKVVPIVLLLLGLGRAVGESGGSRFALLVLVGLSFSLAGDVAIAFSFAAGLALFLVAHLAYIGAMGWTAAEPLAQAAAFLPALILWGGMTRLLWSRVPRELLVPVVVYITVISTMLGRAVGRAVVTDPGRAARLFVVGAMLFVVSDALIAIDKWVFRVAHAQVWILGTYYAAQAFIVSGVWLQQLR